MCTVLFDLRKAFNSVPHRSLLEKLRYLGLSEHILKRIFSYLYEREQFIVLNGKHAVICTAGSVQSPTGISNRALLFLIYINKSTSEPLDSNTCIVLYADDMLLYRVINSPNDYVTLQANVDLLSNWVVKNNLTLNASKCKFMVISRLQKKPVPVPQLKLYNNLLERVSSYKYLGVIISDDLTWTTHINEMSNKARKIVRLIIIPSVLFLVISTSLTPTIYLTCETSP